MPNQTSILLQTKLHRPSITRGLIDRPRLMEQLNDGVDCPLLVVSAPAGFGKTTLVCTWLESMAAGEQAAPLPSAWLSLDEDDSDLNLFVRYFIAALRTIFSEACSATLDLLESRMQLPWEAVSATFCNELAALPGPALVVLDDYHFIRGKDVHNLLNELARHWPKPLRLALISRISPPLPLAGLRAKGVLSEIRTRDLRFTAQETASYLGQAQLGSLDGATLQLLEERIEGWPAGLHLVALSLRSESSRESVLSTLSSANPNVAGYLIDEVLAGLSPPIHDFLLKSSILDRFSASLCEALIGQTDSAWNASDCLDWIARSELFIAPLDDHREWYRYHHLFRQLLQHRLSAEMTPEQVVDLHRRASAWFDNQGIVNQALQHALSAGDFDLAARQMSAGLRDVINREDRRTLERWLSLLPEEMIQQRPDLLMIRVFVLQFTWRLDLQAQVLQQIEAILDSGEEVLLSAREQLILRSLILLIKAEHAYLGNRPAQAADLCRQVLAQFPPSWTFVRGGAMFFLGMSLQAEGQAEAAEQLLLDEYEAYEDKVDVYSLFLTQSLCMNYLNAGLLEQTERMARVHIQRAVRGKMTLMKQWGHWYLGVVHFQRNELEEAAHCFVQIVENRYVAQVSAYRDAVAGLTKIYQIHGESAAAWQMVESISQFDLQQHGCEDDRTSSLRARLMLMQGDLEGSGRWADGLTDPPADRAMLWEEEPQMTRALILVSRGRDADLRLAVEILDILAEIADRTHNTRYTIAILALRALTLDALGKSDQAHGELEQALELSRLGGSIRIFVDLGRPMQQMLRRLVEHGQLGETIRRILASFPVGDNGHNRPVRHPLVINSNLVEPLTPRELEVLTLLREPLSIKEIALNLNTTYATARRHTINIYGKLDVNKRWDAVAQAIELGLLSPD